MFLTTHFTIHSIPSFTPLLRKHKTKAQSWFIPSAAGTLVSFSSLKSFFWITLFSYDLSNGFQLLSVRFQTFHYSVSRYFHSLVSVLAQTQYCQYESLATKHQTNYLMFSWFVVLLQTLKLALFPGLQIFQVLFLSSSK